MPSRVLFIDDWIPDPRAGSGAPRAHALLHAIIAAGARLTVLAVHETPAGLGTAETLLPQAEIAPGRGGENFAPFLDRHLADFDLIIVSRPHNMNAFRLVVGPDRLGALPVVYDAEALFAVREAIQQEVIGEPMPHEARERALADEVALAEGLPTVLAVNEQTAAAFRAAGHADVRVLGHAVAPNPTPAAFDRRDGFLFVGPAYADDTPNSDSLLWFIDHVLPDIRREIGREVPFAIAGIERAPQVASRADGVATLLGPLSDLTAVYGTARVFVAPTRFASGLPLKVLDAAAHGVPAVVTPLLAGQLGWNHEHEVLVAASPQDFAAQCLRLHGDAALWKRLRRNALERVTRDCNPARFNRAVAALLAGRGTA